MACAVTAALLSGCQNQGSNPPPPPQTAPGQQPAPAPGANGNLSTGPQGAGLSGGPGSGIAGGIGGDSNAQFNGQLEVSMVVGDDATVDLFNDTDVSKVQTVRLLKGTSLDVRGYINNKQYGEMALITLDSNDPGIPSQALIRVSDLNRIAYPEEHPLTSLDDVSLSEVDSDDVLAENAARRRTRTPGCYRDVKNQLLRMGLVRTYPPGAAAWMGYSVLTRQYGFRPVAFSQNLPNGAVCVSEGGRYQCGKKKCGHIAVKIGPHRWYGAGVFQNPLLSGHYGLRCVLKSRRG